MLVWYDEKYPQYLGIPWTIFDLAAAVPPVIMVSPVGKNDRPLNISTQESIFPSPPPSPLSKPSSPWKRVSTSLQEKRSRLHPSQDERLCYSKSVANLGENPVKHIQKHGNPPTITKKCKYSSCKKITSATNSCSRGKNVKSPHKAYGAQVPQRPWGNHMRDYTDTRVTPTKRGLRNLPGVPHLNFNRPVAVKKTSSCKWPIVGESLYLKLTCIIYSQLSLLFHDFFPERSQTTQERPKFRHRAPKSALFTQNDLHRCLYGRNQVMLVNKDELIYSLLHEEEVKSYWCKACKQERLEQCKIHGPHQTLRMTTKVNNNNNNVNSNNLQWTNAVQSFPNEVGLCRSGIPGAGYGVCARQLIPLGTWIGPYEGEVLRPEQVLLGTDASYMWEIYHEGKLLYYIDGQDENKSSWMRFIRCARYGSEQNMFAFQYSGNIYYRAFKDIPAGTELLVWYDDNYPQYMGIPLEIRETCKGATSGERPATMNSKTGPYLSIFVRCLMALCKEDPSLCTLHAIVSHLLRFVLSGATLKRNRSRDLWVRKKLTMVVAVPRENYQPGSPYGYSTSPRLVTDNSQQVFHSSHVRSAASTSRASTLSRVRRRSNRRDRSGSENLPTADGYSQAHQGSRTYEDSGASSRLNAQKRVEYALEETNLLPENPVVSVGTTSNRGSVADDSNAANPAAKEGQVRSADEDENSSDGSDASLFNCGQCGKTFAQRSVLQIHVCPNMPHKPYHCGHCSQSFDQPNDLRMHAVIHAGEKPFKCGYCSRSFAGATTLHNHVRTHTGEKPFICERCGKTFTQASQLHRH
ncbi:unnamed protein product, partial [Porites evermanni]